MAITKLAVKCLFYDAPQYIIAASAGIDPSLFSKYRRGLQPIPPHHLISLSCVFHCTPDDIKGWAE